MHTSPVSLDEEGQRIAKRGSVGIMSLLVGGALALAGLLLYLRIAPQPNLILIEIWFAAPGLVVGLGISAINRHLKRTLAAHHVSLDEGERVSDSAEAWPQSGRTH